MKTQLAEANAIRVVAIAAALLLGAIFTCALFFIENGVANLAICTTALIVGTLLSFVLFLKSDEDMRGLNRLFLGAISAASLTQAQAIIERVAHRYGDLASNVPGQKYLGQIFFLGVASGLLGFLGGFLFVRIGGLERAIVDEQRKLNEQLQGIPEVPQVPLPELDEFWPQFQAPPDSVVEALAKTDWSKASASDALRAAAVFFAKERWDDVLKVLEPQIATGDQPSPMAFDLYIGASVVKNGYKPFTTEQARKLDGLSSRMLTYWADSFLVNLDVGFLNLYLPNRGDFAEFYARRALSVRPDSGAANLNLACALAEQVSGHEPREQEVDRIVAALEQFLRVSTDGLAKMNKEGDFDELKKKSPRFAEWLHSKTRG